MPRQPEKICLFIIRWGSYLILLLPLVVMRSTLYPYIFGKIIIFRILVEIIFAAWLFLAVYNPQYRPNWRHPLILTVTIFMGALVLAMFIGIDIARSFWSTQERMTGVLTWLHSWAWFLILISTFRNWADWRKLIWASLICSFLVGLYGLGQKLGWQFLLKKEDVRMSATLGNPDFLGVYAMLHGFLAGFLILIERKWILRGLAILLSGFSLFILFLTATRGAIVAFGISVLLFLFFLIFLLRKSSRPVVWIRILAILLILIIVGGGIFLRLHRAEPWMGKAPYFVQRMVNIGIESDKARLISWEIGIKGFKEKPILGWGWENYNIVFNKYYNPYYLRFGQESTWFDKSHNQIVDLLALTGSLGTITYILVFGAVFWLLLRKHNTNLRMDTNATNRERISRMLLSCMFLSYFIQNLFVFDTPAPLIVFCLSLGLVYFITSTNYELSTNIRKSTINNQQLTINEFPLPILIFLIIIFFPWAIYKFNIEPFSQSKLGIRGVQTSQVNFKSGLYWFRKALAKPCFTNAEIRSQLAKAIAAEYDKHSPDFETVQGGTEFALSELRKNVVEHPLDARYWLYLGQLYNIAGIYNHDYFNKAEEAINKGFELSPKRQQLYFELAKVKLGQNNSAEALEIVQKAIDLDPQAQEAIDCKKKVEEYIRKAQNPNSE